MRVRVILPCALDGADCCAAGVGVHVHAGGEDVCTAEYGLGLCVDKANHHAGAGTYFKDERASIGGGRRETALQKGAF